MRWQIKETPNKGEIKFFRKFAILPEIVENSVYWEDKYFIWLEFYTEQCIWSGTEWVLQKKILIK